MRLKSFLMSLSVLTVCSGWAWCGQDFKIEPGWSHVEFGVKNFGLHTVEGRFKVFGGTITLDEADVTRSTLVATIQIASVDTGIKKRDDHLQTPDFFEAAAFPVMTFHSSRIEKRAGGYVLIGALTIKGHTQDIELPFTYSIEKSPQAVPTLHAEARGAINRHDFGINYGSNFSVGSQVTIVIHIQAVP